MKPTLPVHISRNYHGLLKDVSEETHVPIRYIVEKALQNTLKKDYPKHYNKFKEKKDEGKN